MKKHTILFLAANPGGTDRLVLDREARAIQKELEGAGYRDCFEFETRWAVEPLDLLRELRKLKPAVVHFSGHGGEQRDGLFFQGADGRVQFVSAQAIEQTFGAAGSSVRLVVLNACYRGPQADALLAHVDCVVGMSRAIQDDAARSFAIGFYGGLGERESVEAAYQQGRAAISLQGLRDGDLPQLQVRAGVDAGQIVLAADLPASRIGASPAEEHQGLPSGRSHRLLVATAAMSLLLVTSLIVSAGARRTACGVPGLGSLCAAVRIGGVPTPAEQTLWDDALAQDSCDGLRAYLRTYPQGVYAEEAKSRLEGRWIEETLGPERDVRYMLTVNPKRPLPTEVAARRDAQERGNQDAGTMCKPGENASFVQLLASWAESSHWKCDEGAGGFTCGFDGEIVCRVRNRISAERCRP
jgi:hypothetical protein